MRGERVVESRRGVKLSTRDGGKEGHRERERDMGRERM